MAQSYTPGLTITNRITHSVRRVLPIKGDVLVELGQSVAARDIVARTFMPGDITPLNMANTLSMPPHDVPECMIAKEGDRIEVGDVLARTKGMFGFFKTEHKSKDSGTIETISPVTGQVIIRGEPLPVQVEAYMAGKVMEILPGEGVVIEAEVTFIQGIFGIGGEAHGAIRIACDRHNQRLSPDRIQPDMKGCIIIGGARVSADAIQQALKVGASAIVTGGMDDQDLKEILGYDLGVAITGSEQVGLTIVITEGFGDIAMAERTFSLLKSREGDLAAVNGATQIRAGVMRPEVVIPLSEEEMAQEPEPEHVTGLLDIGRAVRIIRDPYFGQIGKVYRLPHEPFELDSGSRARVLEVTIENGETITIPRANVELIEG